MWADKEMLTFLLGMSFNIDLIPSAYVPFSVQPNGMLTLKFLYTALRAKVDNGFGLVPNLSYV